MTKRVRAVQRAISVLSYLNKRNGSGASDVANATGISRTTVLRLLETLEDEGLVARHGNGATYWLTSHVYQLSAGYAAEDGLVTTARPILEQLSDRLLWPAMLMVPRGTDMVVRDNTDLRSNLVFHRYRVGHTVPILHGASGRCYLAFLPAPASEALLSFITNGSVTPSIRAMLTRIRSRGVAVAVTPERTTVCIAAPVLVEGEARAVVCLRYFRSAMTEAEAVARFQPHLLEAAEKLGEVLRSADRAA